MAKAPLRVAVTGAAGQIGYSLLFRIANGDMLGKDQPVILQLLEIPDEKAQKALKGVMMEIDDCAFPLLAGMSAHSDPMTAFKDIDCALLVGARPRGPGMERKDLLEANAQIFTVQRRGVALGQSARGRQSSQYQCIYRNEISARSAGEKLHRHAAPRSQSRAVANCGQNRQASRIDRKSLRLGQPFADDVR